MKQIITTATNDRLVALHINAITEITGKPILAASKALMIEEAKKQMREGVCHLLYVKKDGKAREAYATLNAPLIHKHIIGTGVSPESWGCSCYFDVEKAGWRSFRWENIITVLS